MIWCISFLSAIKILSVFCEDCVRHLIVWSWDKTKCKENWLVRSRLRMHHKDKPNLKCGFNTWRYYLDFPVDKTIIISCKLQILIGQLLKSESTYKSCHRFSWQITLKSDMKNFVVLIRNYYFAPNAMIMETVLFNLLLKCMPSSYPDTMLPLPWCSHPWLI